MILTCFLLLLYGSVENTNKVILKIFINIIFKVTPRWSTLRLIPSLPNGEFDLHERPR